MRYTDAAVARRHLKALQDAGLGQRRIAELSGVNRKTLQWVVGGRSERGTPPSSRILRTNEEKILGVPVPRVAHHAAAGRQHVPGVGTVRRLQALVAFGYPRSYLAERIGVSPANASRLFRDAGSRVTAATARRVEGLFGELQMTPGPSSRARNEGKRRNWALPFSWDEDDIDDPQAEPRRGESDDSRATAEMIANRRDEVVELSRVGWSASRIAAHLRVSCRTVERDRKAA